MEWIIDRIEEGIAVIECNGKTFELSTEFLPENIKERNVLCVNADKNAEKDKMAQAEALMNRLFKK